MRVTGRQLRLLALAVLAIAVGVILLLPGPPSACRVLPGEYDVPNECGQEGVFTAARVITGAIGIVVALALLFISSIRDVE